MYDYTIVFVRLELNCPFRLYSFGGLSDRASYPVATHLYHTRRMSSSNKQQRPDPSIRRATQWISNFANRDFCPWPIDMSIGHNPLDGCYSRSRLFINWSLCKATGPGHVYCTTGCDFIRCCLAMDCDSWCELVCVSTVAERQKATMFRSL